jgi:hypothetical protein
MRDVLASTSLDYENRLAGLDQQIATNEEQIKRLTKERDEVKAAKALIDDQITKLPKPKTPKE